MLQQSQQGFVVLKVGFLVFASWLFHLLAVELGAAFKKWLLFWSPYLQNGDNNSSSCCEYM